MLKLIFTVCLLTFAAYLPANEQDDTNSQEMIQEALSCNKYKKSKSKESSENVLACGKDKKHSSKTQEEATEDAKLLAFFCPQCTDKKEDLLV